MSVAPSASNGQVQIRALVPQPRTERAKQQQLRQACLTVLAIAATVLVVPASMEVAAQKAADLAAALSICTLWSVLPSASCQRVFWCMVAMNVLRTVHAAAAAESM